MSLESMDQILQSSDSDTIEIRQSPSNYSLERPQLLQLSGPPQPPQDLNVTL